MEGAQLHQRHRVTEQQLLGLIDGGQCPFCTASLDEFHDLSSQVQIRKVKEMQEAFHIAQEHYSAGRHRQMIRTLKQAGHCCNSTVNVPYPPIPNALWMLRFFRYGILSPEEMHDFSGLFMYIISAFKRCIMMAYRGSYKEGPAFFIDQSFMKMPLFTGLPRFTKGILHLKTFTAARYRVLMRTLVPVMADVFPEDDLSWVLLTVSFLDYFSVAKQKIFICYDFDYMLQLLKQFSDNAHDTLLTWSPSNLNFPKFHGLKHIVWFIYFFGCLANYSANVLEALHKLMCKDPWRNSSGIGQEQQVINYVTRHQTMKEHKQYIELLFPTDEEADVKSVSLNDEAAEPQLVGAKRYTKTINGYAKIEQAGTSFYQLAFSEFQRCFKKWKI